MLLTQQQLYQLAYNHLKCSHPSHSLTASLFPFYSSLLSLHPSLPQPPPSGEPFHTLLLSPFHMEEQLRSDGVHSVSLFLSPPSPPTPLLLAATILDPGGITLSEPNMPQTCQMMFVFHPLPVRQRACVLTLSTYLTKCCDMRCTRASTE